MFLCQRGLNHQDILGNDTFDWNQHVNHHHIVFGCLTFVVLVPLESMVVVAVPLKTAHDPLAGEKNMSSVVLS